MNYKFISVSMFSFLIFLLNNSQAAFADRSPCTLLTQAQIATATGMKVGPGMKIGPHKNVPEFCAWTLLGQAKSLGANITLGISPGKAFKFSKAPGHGIIATPVKGFGYEAVYNTLYSETRGEYETDMTVKGGDRCFTVGVYGLPKNQIDKTKDMEMILARDILKNL